MKNILTILLLLLANVSWATKAKKPTIMVVPSDVWCFQHGYTDTFDNQGTIIHLPNYKRAFQENAELIVAISKINGMMAERSFPLKNMESVIKSLEYESAEDAILTSKAGAGIAETPIEKLKKVAKADIIIQLTWKVDSTGPKSTLSCVLQGLDAYTDKQIAEASGTGASTFSADLATLIEEAIISRIDIFNESLQNHFDDMFENGREIVVRIKRFDSWSKDLDATYNGDDLVTIIEDWIMNNTVNEVYNLTDFSYNSMFFEQVRIPLFDEKDHAIDARKFLRNLQKHLAAPPYNIESRLMAKGLGQAILILGAK